MVATYAGSPRTTSGIIRVPVEGPWGAQPAIRLHEGLTSESVVALLTRFIEPLLIQTATTSDLDKFRSAGGLRRAAIIRKARETMGWSDE
jgi:hypothetical protein